MRVALVYGQPNAYPDSNDKDTYLKKGVVEEVPFHSEQEVYREV